MLAKNIFCRDLSLRNGEKLPGTAGPRSTWILIQDHSPWAINAFDDCALNNAVKDYLRQLFAFEKPTILLIRNSDNKVIDQRKLFVVRSIEKQPSLHEFNWRTADDILQLPLAEAIAGQDVGRFDKPLYLVCTHGKRDKCCAKYGPPVFKQLQQRYGNRVWQASHVGGDRFAANLVCLPHGVYYGRLLPHQAVSITAQYEQKQISPDHLRGRCCFPKIVQAAEYFVRQSIGLSAIDLLELEGQDEVAEGVHQIDFLNRQTGQRHQLVVRMDWSDSMSHLTCRAEQPEKTAFYYLQDHQVV